MKTNLNISVNDINANLISEGWHKAHVFYAEWRERKTNPEILDLCVGFEVVDGAFAGSSTFENYALLDKQGGQRHTISVANFAKLLKATGIEGIESTQEVVRLKGKILKIHIKHSVSKKTGSVFANINKYMEV